MNFIEIGAQAHANNEHRAPALNAKVQKAIKGLKVGDPRATQIMKDFTKGYDMAIEEELAAILAA